MWDNIFRMILWLLCFLGFSVCGVICAFYPEIVQKAALSAPTPKWKFIPKPEDMWPAQSMGGRKYFEGRFYKNHLRVTGVLSLMAALLLLLATLQLI